MAQLNYSGVELAACEDTNKRLVETMLENSAQASDGAALAAAAAKQAVSVSALEAEEAASAAASTAEA